MNKDIDENSEKIAQTLKLKDSLTTDLNLGYTKVEVCVRPIRGHHLLAGVAIR